MGKKSRKNKRNRSNSQNERDKVYLNIWTFDIENRAKLIAVAFKVKLNQEKYQLLYVIDDITHIPPYIGIMTKKPLPPAILLEMEEQGGKPADIERYQVLFLARLKQLRRDELLP